MDVAVINSFAANVARALARVETAHPNDHAVNILHANLEVLDSYLQQNLEGYVPAAGTPKPN
jgi:hypothetical protein